MSKLVATERGFAIKGKSETSGKTIEYCLGSVHYGTFPSKGRYDSMGDVQEVTILADNRWLLKGHVTGKGPQEVLIHPKIGDSITLRGGMAEVWKLMNENRLK